MNRQCSRPGCASQASATLTYDYRAGRAHLERLDDHAHPMAYDLCEAHADGLSVPRGWELHDRRVVRVLDERRQFLAS